MKCEATIVFRHDFGGNHTTFHCQLDRGHEGPHQEKSDVGWEKYGMPYAMKWEGSEGELKKSFQK